MAVILKRKLVFQYEKNSKINILSDNFRVLAWKFSTSFRKINSFVAVVYFFLRLLSHLMKWDDKGSFFIAQYDFWATTESLQCQYTTTIWHNTLQKYDLYAQLNTLYKCIKICHSFGITCTKTNTFFFFFHFFTKLNFLIAEKLLTRAE